MSKTLVIAEKPSVGQDIAKVLPGAATKGEGFLELPDHVGVVHDLLTHVDRGAVAFEGRLDGLHGPVHPRTVAPGLGEQYASGSRGHVPYGS